MRTILPFIFVFFGADVAPNNTPPIFTDGIFFRASDSIELRKVSKPWPTEGPQESSSKDLPFQQQPKQENDDSIPPFGGLTTEEQLRDLIQSSVKPVPALQNVLDGNSKKSTKPPLPIEELPAFQFDSLEYPPNGPPELTQVALLFYTNRELISSLNSYDPDEVRKKLERQMQAEQDQDNKLFLSAMVAPRGSSKAAMYLLERMKSTDYEEVRGTHIALRHTLYAWKADPPDWIVEMVKAVLADKRPVSNPNYSSSTQLTVSYVADEDGNLTGALGRLRCKNAVPFLIEMCRKTEGARGPVMALGDIGDKRAIPVLIECLKRAGATVKYRKGFGFSDHFTRPVHALAQLKAKEATDELLKHLACPMVIDSIAIIGDRKAVKPLEQLIEDGGNVVENGRAVYPELSEERVVSAKIAIACLDEKDSVVKLCALLNDESFGEFQRREVIWRLGDRQDPNAIPFLVAAIKNDPSGAVINQAITVLSVFKYKAAVDGLIDCFDADFEDKSDWKRAYTAEMFRENIAESLQHITNQRIGANKQEWLDWWQANRDKFKEAE